MVTSDIVGGFAATGGGSAAADFAGSVAEAGGIAARPETAEAVVVGSATLVETVAGSLARTMGLRLTLTCHF